MSRGSSVRWEHFEYEMLPELVHIGYDEPKQAVTLEQHYHPHAFEFVYIEKGKAAWETEDGVYETRAGDLFHTRPDEPHRGGYDVIEPCRFWWIIIRAPERYDAMDHSSIGSIHGSWLNLTPDETRTLLNGLAQLPRVKTIGLDAAERFRRIRQSLESRTDLSGLECRIAMIDLMLLFLRSQTQHNVQDETVVRLQQLIRDMETHPERRPSVPQLSAQIQVSPSYFHHLFLQYTGLSPQLYMERIRVREAGRRLTETDQSVTQIAMDLGYASSQHFATAFRRVTGRTPTRWRLDQSRE